MQADYVRVLALLERYLEGLYRCDVELLNTVFHQQAQYFTASTGELIHMDMSAYLPIVDGRTSPKDSGEARVWRVDAIEFSGPVTAFARVSSTMFGNRYDDFLSLVRVDGEWRVISKVFHSELATSGEVC